MQVVGFGEMSLNHKKLLQILKFFKKSKLPPGVIATTRLSVDKKVFSRINFAM